MDEQNINSQNRDSIRTDGSIVAAESEKLKKLFVGLAVLVVFVLSLSVPLYLSYKAQEKAKEMRVKMDMSQVRNWAQVYEINNQTYRNFEKDSELIKVFKDINSMGGVADIFISKDSSKYCCQVQFTNKSLGTWCVDDSGYVGANGQCEKNNIKCE